MINFTNKIPTATRTKTKFSIREKKKVPKDYLEAKAIWDYANNEFYVCMDKVRKDIVWDLNCDHKNMLYSLPTNDQWEEWRECPWARNLNKDNAAIIFNQWSPFKDSDTVYGVVKDNKFIILKL